MSDTSERQHGITTAVLTQDEGGNSRENVPSSISQMQKKAGLFLVSKDVSDNPRLPIKQNITPGSKKRNRKRVITDDEITHGGRTYRVNAKKSGLYAEILTRMIDQFEIAASLWSRVLVLRFDLHQDVYTADNLRISRFVKRLTTKLKRAYGFKKIGFTWVREQEKAKAQHYHFVLFLEGRRVRHSQRLIEIIREAWESPVGGYHVPHVPKPFYFGSRDEIADNVIYRISYLAKVRGKGYRPDQTKDYQTSRIKRPA